MGPTQISVAILMVGVAVATVVWLQSSQAAASSRRMRGMMTRIGLNPGLAMLGEPPTIAIMKEARRRCRRCPREGLCDRWLAGKVKGDNTFCPNAQTFDILTDAGGRTN
jgi:hypothetical protein